MCVTVSGYHSDFGAVLVSTDLATLVRPSIVIFATSVAIVDHSCGCMWQVNILSAESGQYRVRIQLTNINRIKNV